jgi:PAS domain S-box-containing protein
MTNKNLLKILFVEDLLSDAELAILELRKEGLRFEHTRVDTRSEFIKALNDFRPDIVISDYMMPSYNGMQALKDAHELDPLVPFILCTGSMNEETAVECLKAGANDYIIKEHLTRLPFAVKEALEQHRIQIEKRAAELLLKENEEKLQSIFRAAPVGIGLVVNRIFMEVNDTFCTMTGYTRKELIGKSAEMIYATIEEFDSVGIEKYGQIAEKGTGSVETRFKCKDGRILNIFLSSTPLDKDDLMKGVTFTVMDITERKLAEEALRESEEKYRLLIDTANESIIVAQDGLLKFVNNMTIELLEGYSEEELIGRPFPEFIHPDDQKIVVENYRRRIANEAAQQRYNFRVVTRNGTVKWVELNAVLIEWQGKPATLNFLSDITERKLAEIALRNSEEKYRRIFENVLDLYYETTIEGTIIEVSPSIEYLSKGQYHRDDLIGKSMYNFYSETGERDALIEQIKKRGSVSDFEITLKNRDGSLVPCSISSKIFFDAQGRPEKIIGSMRDITDRKKADEVLRESESSLRDAQEIAKMGSWEWDIVTQKTTWSDNYFAIHGFKPTEVEPSFEFFRNRIHPDDLHLLDEIHAKIMKDKTPSSLELQLIQPDGTLKWIQNNISPVVEDDKLVKLKGVIIDITERKQALNALRESEVRYKTLFSNAAEGILVAKIETMQFLYANPALCKMFGYTEEELIRLGVKDIHPKESLDYVRAEFETQIRGEKTLASDLSCLRKDGTLFYADIRSTLMVLDGFKCNVGFFIDITDRKQAEKELLKHHDHLEELVNERTEELSKAKKEAEEANKAKSEFLANMSHEIRTPMNAVLGYTELLSSTPVDQTQKNYINSIKSSGKSLLTLINDILDLSKIEAGKLEMEYEYVDTYSFFSEFERIFSHKVSEKGLKFILDITSGTPAGINIDEARVRQIVFNLIGNAIKFTSEGKIVLKVFTENPQIVNYSKEKSEELIDLIIEVQDTGIGISTELQEAIFEPFVQERDNKHRGGTGLGLTITRRLTALMDGTIHVQSKPGRGSIFTVRIPEIAYLRDFSKTTVDIQIDPSEIVFEKASILIADDVEHNRSYLRDALKNTRLKIIEAEDGITAYKLAKEIVPDLIIADILMPKMDGFQLLDKIKTDKKLKQIPVIAYSASVLKGQKERIHNSEFAGLLIKPVKVAELYLELMNFLPYKSTKAAEPDKPLSEVDLIGEITNLPGLIHSLETGFYTTWKTFAVRQPIGEIRDFGKSLIQLGMDHNSSIITGYGKELISAADSFNIEVILILIEKYKGIIKSLKDSTKNLNNG